MSTILSGARQLTCPVFGILLRAVFSGLLPKALRLNFNNERMMNQAINSSHRHCRVRKDRIPSTEGVISRNQQTAEFIAMGNQLKQHRGFRLRAFHIAEIIENKQIVFVKFE